MRTRVILVTESLLTQTGVLPVKGVKAITYIATCPEKQVVLSVLCSLLNTVSLTCMHIMHLLILVDPQIQSSDLARAI